MNVTRVLWAALLSMSAGCSTQVYDGEARSAADESVLTLVRSEPNMTFGGVVIDGHSLSSSQYGFTTDFRLLPGVHKLSFGYRIDADAYCDIREHLCPAVVVNGHCSGSFSSEAGKGYVAELVNRGASVGAVVRRARQVTDLMASTGQPLAELSCERSSRGAGL